MFLIRNSKIIIGLIIIGIIISFIFIPKLKVKHDLNSFFVEGDPDLEFYNDFRKSFNSDENILMIAIHHEQGIYNYKLLQDIHDFTIKCQEIPQVIEASSITTIKDIVKSPFGFTSFPFLHYKDSLKYKSDSTRIARNENINGWYISKDAKAVTVILEIDHNIDEQSKDLLISTLDNLIEIYSFNQVHFAGSLNYETRYYRMIEKEIQFNILLCSIVIMLILILIFRTIQGVLLPAITVIIAMIFLYGLLGIFNRPLNVLSTLFPTIMLVVGVSNLIHFLSKYRDLLSKGLEKKQAILETYKELRITIFLTSFTTAIGFFSLTISSMKAFRDFGLEAGIGVLISFIVTISFVPSVLHFMKVKSFFKKQKSSIIGWTKLLNNIFKIVINYPNLIVAIVIFAFIVSIIGILRIDNNNYILSNFTNNTPIKNDFLYFEKHLSGVRTFELAINVKDGDSLTNINVLEDINSLHLFLEKDSNYRLVQSPVSIYKTINQVYNAGSKASYRLPLSQKLINDYKKMALKINKKLYHLFIDSTGTKGRITARMMDIGTDNLKLLRENTRIWINNNISTKNIEFHNTGAMYLTDKSNDYLIWNMLLSLALAFFVVSVIMFLLFKDIKMVIISLIPNILPLFIVSSIIGFTGIIFNGSIAIIFTIGFVIAVDDTIHLLSKFKIEINKGNNVKRAIEIALQETGKAIIITTVILFFGFIVLLHSELKGVFYQGLLIAIMLLVALIGDLFLLPVLLIRFNRKTNQG